MPEIPLVGGGAIRPDGLGFTLIHEHLKIESEGVRAQWPHLYDPSWQFERALAEVRAAVAAGVRTICDPTVLGLGRDVPFMERVVAATDAQMVAATGLYTFRDLPRIFRSRSVDFLADLFVRDIADGVQGTRTRAGFIKFATDAPGVTAGVEVVIRAAARAQRRTGVPIVTHSDARNGSGLDQVDLLVEEGVDPARVVIGHVGDSEDVDYLVRLLERGVYLGLDRYGSQTPPADRRNATTLALLERGYADRLLLAQDACATIDWYEAPAGRQGEPSGHMAYVATEVLPALRAGGATAEDIETLTVANPRRLFGG